jgi:hypothetical protein
MCRLERKTMVRLITGLVSSRRSSHSLDFQLRNTFDPCREPPSRNSPTPTEHLRSPSSEELDRQFPPLNALADSLGFLKSHIPSHRFISTNTRRSQFRADRIGINYKQWLGGSKKTGLGGGYPKSSACGLEDGELTHML